MSLEPATLNLMREMAKKCIGTLTNRLDENNPTSDLYRKFVRHVFDSTAKRAYPITFSILNLAFERSGSRTLWEQLVDEMLTSGKATDPYLWKMPAIFQDSDAVSSIAGNFDMPWLNDLLCFEWAEIEVHMMPEKEPNACDYDSIAINPDHLIIHLQYPVFRTAQRKYWSERGDYFVCCFRRKSDFVVRYLDLSPLIVALWEWWIQKAVTVQEMVNQILEMAPTIDVGAVRGDVLATLLLLESEGLVIKGAIARN